MALFTKKSIDFVATIKKNRVIVLIGSILGIVLGVLLTVFGAAKPLHTAGAILWIVIVCFGLSGLGLIIRFIFPRKGESRDGLSLFLGILIVALVVMAIILAVYAPSVKIDGQDYPGGAVVTARVVLFLCVFFGVYATIENIFLLCCVGNVPSGQKTGYVIKCILGIIISILLIIFPFFFAYWAMVIAGIYITIMSVVVLVADIKFWNATSHIEKTVNNVKDTIDAKVEEIKKDK